MRLLVISDIHANFTALQAVLSDSADKWDEVVCLGDTVGYGPRPNECIETVGSLPVLAVPGNHDWAAIGRIDLDFFNPNARKAVEWTRTQLTPQSYVWLSSLQPVVKRGDLTLFHGSPVEPVTDYILNIVDACGAFDLLETHVGLFGHSHVDAAFCRSKGGAVRGLSSRKKLRMNRECGYLLNPGSVGQPRSGDPRAAYAIFDTEKLKWEPRRVSYDIENVQSRMKKQGLPHYLIQRLAEGR